MYRPYKLTIDNLMSHEHTEFMFRQGKAILILGENYDDAGQFRNGSGKSALIEGIAIAITGSSIRDVKPRELVNRGADSLTVELILTNITNGQTLRIIRRLFSSQSKSSQCQIFVTEGKSQEQEVTTCPDINSYNKWIFETIGITKEDFFSFFLITKEMYEPFLSVGDVKKKQIINRFSGADIVDKTDVFVKQDSLSKQTEIDTVQKQVTELELRMQVLQENIDKLREERSEERIQQKVNELRQNSQLKISNAEVRIKELEQQILLLQQEQKILAKEREDIERNRQELKQQLTPKKTLSDIEGYLEHQQSLSLLEEKIEKLDFDKSYANIPNLFTDEIETIKKTEVEILNDLKLINTRVDSNRKRLSIVSGILHGSIECPNCQHQFLLPTEKETKTLEEYEVEKSQLTISLSEDEELAQNYLALQQELTKDKESVNTKIIQEREKLTQQKDLLYQEKSKLQSLEEEFRNLLREENKKIEVIEEEIASCERHIKVCLDTEQLKVSQQSSHDQMLVSQREFIEQINKDTEEQIASLYQQSEEKILECVQNIESLTEQCDKKKKELDRLNEEKQSIDSWTINFKNFKSFLANQSIKNIGDYTNLFLNLMGSDLSIKIDGYRTLASGQLKEEIQTTILRRGFEEGSYGCFSGGERGRIDFACILALQELINVNCEHGRGLDLLYIDEALDSVESLGLQSIIESAQGLEKTIAVVSQQEINTDTNVVIVRKENKVSKLF